MKETKKNNANMNNGLDNKPIVSIVMGSDSDLHIMKEAANILEEFKIDYEINILSAHRTPKKSLWLCWKSYK